jgi:hypothetical protein
LLGIEGMSQLGGQGGQGQSAETAAVNIKAIPASNNNFFNMIENLLVFFEM